MSSDDRRAQPLAAPATTTGEDERPIAAGSAGNPRARIGDGGLCRDCGSWSPVGHAEAHDHYADCPSATPPAAPAAVTITEAMVSAACLSFFAGPMTHECEADERQRMRAALAAAASAGMGE